MDGSANTIGSVVGGVVVTAGVVVADGSVVGGAELLMVSVDESTGRSTGEMTTLSPELGAPTDGGIDVVDVVELVFGAFPEVAVVRVRGMFTASSVELGAEGVEADGSAIPAVGAAVDAVMSDDDVVGAGGISRVDVPTGRPSMRSGVGPAADGLTRFRRPRAVVVVGVVAVVVAVAVVGATENAVAGTAAAGGVAVGFGTSKTGTVKVVTAGGEPSVDGAEPSGAISCVGVGVAGGPTGAWGAGVRGWSPTPRDFAGFAVVLVTSTTGMVMALAEAVGTVAVVTVGALVCTAAAPTFGGRSGDAAASSNRARPVVDGAWRAGAVVGAFAGLRA